MDDRERSASSLVAILLIGSLGCAPQATSGQVDEADLPPALKVFADEPFYRQSEEPEEVIVGILRAAVVREGPDTRDMPFKLVTGEEELSVYSSGFDENALRRFVDREVEVVGKRVDQRREGYGMEIWIATMKCTAPRCRLRNGSS